MNHILLIATSLAGIFGLLLFFLFRRLLSVQGTLPVSTTWIEEISAARYRPMDRLLRREDYRFLASQPGFSRQTLTSLRRERRQAFRGYLRCLKDDFQMVSTALRLLLLQSAQDRPDLARTLLTQQIRFQAGLLEIHCHLLLDACGWRHTLNANDLVRGLELLGRELRQIIPAPVEPAFAARIAVPA